MRMAGARVSSCRGSDIRRMKVRPPEKESLSSEVEYLYGIVRGLYRIVARYTNSCIGWLGAFCSGAVRAVGWFEGVCFQP